MKPFVALEACLEVKKVLSGVNNNIPNNSSSNLNTNPNSSNTSIEKEIEEFSSKLREYYIELGKASKTIINII